MATSFRGQIPETRADRAARQVKTTLEKTRLMQRRECFVRYEDIGNPTEPAKNSLSYIDDAHRFHTDTAGDIKVERDRVVQRREEKFENKRNNYLSREETRCRKNRRRFSGLQSRWYSPRVSERWRDLRYGRY